MAKANACRGQNGKEKSRLKIFSSTFPNRSTVGASSSLTSLLIPGTTTKFFVEAIFARPWKKTSKADLDALAFPPFLLVKCRRYVPAHCGVTILCACACACVWSVVESEFGREVVRVLVQPGPEAKLHADVDPERVSVEGEGKVVDESAVETVTTRAPAPVPAEGDVGGKKFEHENEDGDRPVWKVEVEAEAEEEREVKGSGREHVEELLDCVPCGG